MLKKIVFLFAVGFVVYYLLTAPSGAANVVQDAWDGIMNGFSQVGIFFNELVN